MKQHEEEKYDNNEPAVTRLLRGHGYLAVMDLSKYQVSGTGCQVSGTGCQVSGVRFQVQGVKFQVAVKTKLTPKEQIRGECGIEGTNFKVFFALLV
jgi:hypothetical protein